MKGIERCPKTTTTATVKSAAVEGGEGGLRSPSSKLTSNTIVRHHAGKSQWSSTMADQSLPKVLAANPALLRAAEATLKQITAGGGDDNKLRQAITRAKVIIRKPRARARATA